MCISPTSINACMASAHELTGPSSSTMLHAHDSPAISIIAITDSTIALQALRASSTDASAKVRDYAQKSNVYGNCQIPEIQLCVAQLGLLGL